MCDAQSLIDALTHSRGAECGRGIDEISRQAPLHGRLEGESPMAVSPITVILQEVAAGDKGAFDRLIPLIYREMRQLADAHLRRERPGHTLQPTALVHEAYMRMVDQDHPDYRGRAHFMGVAAHVMRQILIDHARSRNAAKRGSGA